MPEVIRLNGSEVRCGENQSINIEIARLPTHTDINLPIQIFRGEEDGPVLLLTAGLHGDEVNGIETLRKLIENEKIIPKRGTTIVIPVVNIFGFIHFSRALPDGKDLNRSFPGSREGSLARRIAYVLTNHILPLIDYGIDFHTGGASRTNYPQVRCVFADPVSLELARAFQPPYLLNSPLIDKSFRKAASRLGKPVIIYEGGESLRFDNQAIKEGMRGCLRVMNHLGMADQPVRDQQTRVLGKSSWIRAKSAGVFRSFVEAGEEIHPGKLLGSITDPFGESKVPVKARRHGFIIGLNNLPVVNWGEALYHVGLPEAEQA